MKNFGLKTATAVFLTFGLGATASAMPYSYAGPSANNIDNTATTNVTLNIADNVIINDLNVSVNVLGGFGTTGFPGNLNIWLSHGGVSVDLFNSTGVFSGAAGGIMDLTFDDEAATSTPTAPPFIGTVKAVDLLSAFDGSDLFGDWVLSFNDPTVFPGEGDDLISWSLHGDATIASVSEPATLALFGLGLAGLGAVRRKKSA